MIINRKKKGISFTAQKSIYGYMFTLPFTIGFLLFFLSPLVLYIVMAFSSMGLNNYGMVIKFIGLDNFNEVFNTQTFYIQQIVQNLGDLMTSLPAIVIFSLFISMILNQKFKGRFLARAIFFLPVIIASGALALSNLDGLTTAAIKAVTNNQNTKKDALNLINVIVDLFGQSHGLMGFNFIEIVMRLVQKIYLITSSSGVQILIFLAGLQTISPSLYEASHIDGATRWENFWKITLPMISPLIIVNSVYTVIDYLGGPQNDVITNIYKTAMIDVKYTLSAAMGSAYYLIILAVLGLVIYLLSKVVYYEDR